MTNAVDYYWMKAEEAIGKIGTDRCLEKFYVSVGIAYKILAEGEGNYASRLPGRPPRKVKPYPRVATGPVSIEPDRAHRL
jgi:hypothetical protein